MSESAHAHGEPAHKPAAARRVQQKLSVSEPGDVHEREADAVAARVTSGQPAPAIGQLLTPPHRRRAPDDKKPVQRAAADEESVERAVDDEKPVQRAPDEERLQRMTPDRDRPRSADDRPALQRATDPHRLQAQPAPGSRSLGDVAQAAVDAKGPGRALDPSVRAPIERSLGADLGAVRLHDDAASRAAASNLGARAFTHGSDIWLGPGESSQDLALMAHEAAHVVQQGSVAQRWVQRNGSAAEGGDAGAPRAIAITNDRIDLPFIELPDVADKAAVPVPLEIPKTPEPRTNQRQRWRDEITGPGVSSSVDAFLPANRAVPSPSGEPIFYLKIKGTNRFLIGDTQRLKEQLKLPNWTERGEPAYYDVDHIRELQLGGADEPSNYQLLDASANRSSGSKIRAELRRKISAGIAHEVGAGKHWPTAPDPSDVKQRYQVRFLKVRPTMEIAGDPKRRFKYDDIAKHAKHLPGLDVLDGRQVEQHGLRGSSSRLTIYTADAAGVPRHFKWAPNAATQAVSRRNWIRGFDLTSITYTPGSSGELTGQVFSRHRALEGGPLTVELDEIDGVPYTLRVRASTIRSRMRSLLRAKQASPIELREAGLLDDGVNAVGVLRPTLPFLRDGLEIDIGIEGDDITLSTTFGASDLALPGPIRVTQADLALTAGTRGLAIEGNAAVEIPNLAAGSIMGRVSRRGDLELEGRLDFDNRTFDPARVTLAYRDGELSGGGTLGIPGGRIPGVRSATITASYTGGVFTAGGTVQPQIPGVHGASLAATYSEAEGLTIGGELTLEDVPGIRSGALVAEVSKPPGSDRFKVTARGTAIPSIPGLNTELSIRYDDGTFDIAGQASYRRGMMEGSAAVGVTNQVLDASGTPTGERAQTLTVYGGGEVTVRIAPWLQGTVGIRFLPNGEMELTGEIALPDALDVFPAKTLDRNIFSINLDIPVIGFAVAGQRVGVFATIGGGLDLSAGIGPGQLRELGVDITYNPDHEDQTRIHGGARLVIPAHAGLRLFVRGAIGAGIPIVSASLGLEVGGRLGLEGAAEAGVSVDWTPSTGLVLDALGEIYVQPKFRFDLTGFLNVEADLLLTSITLYEERWELAAFELGPDFRFGMRFPVHYQEGQPFDVPWDQVAFDVPDVDTGALLRELVARVV